MRAPRATGLVSAAVLTIALTASVAPAASSAQPLPASGASTARPCQGLHEPALADGFRYDPHEPTADQIAAADASLRRAERAMPRPPAKAKAKAITIDVYVHVLRSASGGGVQHRRIERQIAVLNSGFSGGQSPFAAASPFTFRLADVDVTVNARWSRMDEGTLAEQHAKRSLHRGEATDLNLYIGRNRSGSLGWGTQPTRLDSEPKLDGVVIARRTLPGGSGGRYSAGDAAVHETGHWLGLFHTFAGKCHGRGDFVADTPREAKPSYRCPMHRDTCSAPGDDPVHNFMDYSPDSCMNQFTAGQATRMKRSWTALRVATTSSAPSSRQH
jgi:hypothetical protein